MKYFSEIQMLEHAKQQRELSMRELDERATIHKLLRKFEWEVKLPRCTLEFTELHVIDKEGNKIKII